MPRAAPPKPGSAASPAPVALSKALEEQAAYVRQLESENAKLAKLAPLNKLLEEENKKLRDELEVWAHGVEKQ